MTTITLSHDQFQQWQAATDAIQVMDASGNVLLYVPEPVSSDVLAVAIERSKSDGPWHTTAEVLNRLESLDN
jgi:hypothetical protein